MNEKSGNECCTEQSLKAFGEIVSRHIRAVPGWRTQTSYNAEMGSYAYQNMLAVAFEAETYCNHKVLILAKAMNHKPIYDFVLKHGNLSVEQVRDIGENELREWDEIIKITDIFVKPHSREDVLNYIEKIDNKYVIAAGIKTGVLTEDDVRKIALKKVHHGDFSITKALIESHVLTQDEVTALLQSYGRGIDRQVSFFLKTYYLRGHDLLKFIEAMVKIDPSNSEKLWNMAFAIDNHGLEPHLAYLVQSGAVKVSGTRTAVGGSCC